MRPMLQQAATDQPYLAVVPDHLRIYLILRMMPLKNIHGARLCSGMERDGLFGDIRLYDVGA